MALQRSDSGLRADVALGSDPERGRDVWCALVDRTARDLRPYRRLYVRASATRPLRVDAALVVRESGGERRYRRSLKLTPRVQSHRLELTSFRRLGGEPPAAPFTSVERVLLVYEGSNAYPGSAATLHVEELRLE